MSNSGFSWSALPNRRVMIGWLAGALVSGSLLGLVIGIVAPTSPGAGTVSVASTASTHPASPTTSPSTSPTATRTTKTKPIRTTTLTALPVPTDFVQQPWNDPTFVLATLQSLNHQDPNNIQLFVTPAKLLTGQDAAQYLQSLGQQPGNLAVQPVAGAGTETFILSRNAAVWGQTVLGGNGLHRFNTVDDFLGVADGVLAQDQHPAIWIKRGADGTVVYLAEQALS